MKLKKEFVIGAHEVMTCCIRNNFYTKGNNSEYNHILSYADNNEATDDVLIYIAGDIYNHSDLKDFEEAGYDYNDIIAYIIKEMFTYSIILVSVEE